MSDAALTLAVNRNTEAIKQQTSAIREQTKAIDALNANIAIYIRDGRERSNDTFRIKSSAPVAGFDSPG